MKELLLTCLWLLIGLFFVILGIINIKILLSRFLGYLRLKRYLRKGIPRSKPNNIQSLDDFPNAEKIRAKKTLREKGS
jgi:hypothetical protein